MSSNDIFKYGIRGEDKPKIFSLPSLTYKKLRIPLYLLLIIILVAFFLGRATVSDDCSQDLEDAQCSIDGLEVEDEKPIIEQEDIEDAKRNTE